MVEDLSAINHSVNLSVPNLTTKGLTEGDENPTLPGITSDVVVIRSKKRRRNVSAYLQGGKIYVSIPARLTKAEEREIVPQMVAKIKSKETRVSENELSKMSDLLLQTYAPEITTRAATVSWRTMNERWGSCTNLDRTIRIADRLAGAPGYVLEYVVFHESIHLENPNHDDAFYEILNRYPKMESAEAFLAGYEAGSAAGPAVEQF